MMSINLGAAIAGGGGKGRRELDFYPTPWEATAALCDAIDLPKYIWEPACGDGAMAKVLSGRGRKVYASDLVDRGFGDFLANFLEQGMSVWEPEHAIVTNPPFSLAEDFIRHARKFTPKVAMLLKTTFFNAAKRLPLFEEHPPSHILPLTWRLDFTNGGSPTMDCTWFVWGYRGQVFRPLPKPKLPEYMQ